jgi:poly [ADP-ribose] polymerase 10/14/15
LYSLKIERVQNKLLYQSYLLHKELLNKKNNNYSNEKVLYHGTDEKNVNLICEKGFNRSYCGTNGLKEIIEKINIF